MGRPRVLHLRGFSSAPPGTPRDSGSEDTDSDSSSASAAPVASAALLAELVYDFCPEARPVSDSAPPPRCGFEAWFDLSLASSSSRPRYRVYPRVDAVVSKVADRAAALHRRSKLLSAILLRKIHRYAVADQPLFAAPLPVNQSFSRLSGAAAVGSKRWGSVTFAEMERLVRLFRCQLEATSSSLWMMSGILATLKHDGFNTLHPGLIRHGHCLRFCFSGVSGASGGIGVGVPSLYASGVFPGTFEGPDSGAAETRARSHPRLRLRLWFV